MQGQAEEFPLEPLKKHIENTRLVLRMYEELLIDVYPSGRIPESWRDWLDANRVVAFQPPKDVVKH